MAIATNHGWWYPLDRNSGVVARNGKIEVIMPVTSFTPESWDTRVVHFEPRIHYTWAWMKFILSCHGGEPLMLSVLRDGEEIGIFVGVVFRCFGIRVLGAPMEGWTTPYLGLLLASNYQKWAAEALDAIREYAFSELQCDHFEHGSFSVSAEYYAQRGWRVRTSQGYQVDLTQGEDAVFASFDPACRRNVRKARKEGVVIEQAEDESFADDYFRQLVEVFAKQGKKPTYNLCRIRNLIHHVGPTGKLLLLRAVHPRHGCIATGIFPCDDRWMYFFGGASYRKGQIYRPNELLQWTAMTLAIKRGVQYYDMGGGGEYKKKYGGRPIYYCNGRLSRNRVISWFREMARKLLMIRLKYS